MNTFYGNDSHKATVINVLGISNTHINPKTSYNQYSLMNFIIIHIFQICVNL